MARILAPAIFAGVSMTCVMTWMAAYGKVEAVAQMVPDRFTVVSQQFLDSGAKVIVVRDRSQPDRQCYAIYEAGAGVVLDDDIPCK